MSVQQAYRQADRRRCQFQRCHRGVAHGTASALVAAAASAFVAGLLIIPLGRETRGKTLPE
jgi:hypothetical protein